MVDFLRPDHNLFCVSTYFMRACSNVVLRELMNFHDILIILCMLFCSWDRFPQI